MEYRAMFLLRRDVHSGMLDLDACNIEEWPFDPSWTQEDLDTLAVMHPKHPMVVLVNKFAEAHRHISLRRRYESQAFGPFYARLGKRISRDELLTLLTEIDDKLRANRQSIGLFPEGYMFDFIVRDFNETEEVNHEDQ